MSPDPSSQRSEEEINSGTVYFMAVPDDDEEDYMAGSNEVHELDFSSHESDFTDDDDDEAEGHTTANSNVPNGTTANTAVNSSHDNDAEGDDGQVTGRMMARYQLLIPFPPASSSQDPSTTEDDEEQEVRYEHQPQQPPEVQLHSSTLSEEVTIVADTAKEALNESENSSPREIVLNDDKVKVIKNAMKGFTLPSTSIPPWVNSIDESSWKDTLVELTKKSTSTTN